MTANAGPPCLSGRSGTAWRLLAWIHVCWLVLPVTALERQIISRDYSLTIWGTEDGLPAFSVRSLAQTRDGYLWLGTFHGLCRFDGVRFTSFTISDTPGLVSDNVTVLYQDSSGDLWIGTQDRGLIRYREGRFEPFGQVRSAERWSVHALCEDAQGTLWVAGSTGLLRRTGNALEPLADPHASLDGFVREVCVGPDDRIWVGTEEGVGFLERDHSMGGLIPGVRPVKQLAWGSDGGLWALYTSRRMARPTPDGRSLVYWSPESFRITTLCPTRSGRFWMGVFEQGIFQGAPGEEPRRVAETPGLVNVLFEDQEGHLWAGVENSGLWCFRPSAVRVLGRELGLANENTTCVFPDEDGTVWVGTMGRGLFRWTDGAFEPVEVSPDAGNISSVWRTADGSLWCGTVGGGLFHRQPGKAFSPVAAVTDSVRTLLEDRRGDLWVGTASSGVLRLDRAGAVTRIGRAAGLSDERVLCLAEDREGTIWIGTEQGLNHVVDDRIEVYRRKDGLGADAIRALLVDRQGVLWIGTLNGGLTRRANGRFSTVTPREGLPTPLIEQLLEGDDGGLWMGSGERILRADLGELNACLDGEIHSMHCSVLDQNHGLPRVVVGTGFQPSCARQKDGQLWFCTGLGVAVVDPAQVRRRSSPPRVYIEAMQWNVGSAADPPVPLHPLAASERSITIPPGRSRLEFRYTGLSFSAPDRVRFRYRLEGYDAEWVEAGRQRTAHYTQVPPGAYRFRVIAANNEGAWNVEGAFLSVTVLPGWWQTGWFRSLVLAATLGVVAMAYRYRIRHVRETERVRLRIARDLHDEVGSNLGSIALLSQAAAGSASQAAATEFSEIHKLARKTADAMRDIVWLINPDEDRLERLVLRMKETAGQLLAGTPWRMQAPEALPAERLSTEFKRHVFLIYKEALHNAARHARASLVEIELQLHGRRLELTISDDGTGIPPQLLHSGQGLDNMRRRAAEIGGTIRIGGEPGTGTIIHLSAPFR